MNTTPTTSVSVLTIDTAPLDIEALGKVGRFQLRRLAEALCDKGIEICDTDTKKTAFMGLKLPDMAAELFTALKAYREASGQPVPKQPKAPVTRAAEPVEEAKEPVQEEVSKEEVRPAKAPVVNGVASPPIAREGDIVELHVPKKASFDANAKFRADMLELNNSLIKVIAVLVDKIDRQEELLQQIVSQNNLAIGLTVHAIDKIDGGSSIANILKEGQDVANDIPFLLRSGTEKIAVEDEEETEG